jgi:hypothetical protein
MTAIADDSRTAVPTTPPPGWERETPKYRVTIKGGVFPSPNNRHPHETPFTNCSDPSVWQYAERPFHEGEIIETRSWPHASFFPLNYSAKKVLEFFATRQKSRLARSPWAGDRIRLDDGLNGAGPTLPQIALPQLKRVDLRPAS